MTPPTTPPKSPTSLKTKTLAPIEIRTSQALGFQVPLGLVMTQLRTENTQAIVMDEKSGMVVLTNQGAVPGPAAPDSDESSLLETTIAGVSMFA